MAQWIKCSQPESLILKNSNEEARIAFGLGFDFNFLILTS
jgi:hypothetical protein